VAYSFVQVEQGLLVTSGTTVSANYSTQNVGTGNLLVAVISRAVASGTVPSIGQVTDDKGNYWKQAVEFQDAVLDIGGSQGTDIWYCESAGGGNKPTVTGTLSGFPVNTISEMNMLVLEYSGNSGHELVDQIGQASITTTSVSIETNYNLADAGDLLISVVTGNMTAATVPTSHTSRLADITQKYWVADLIGPTQGSQATAAWTGLTAATKGVGIIVCFKAAGATSGPTLLQSSYSNAAYPVATPLTSWTSQAFPVNPTAGNLLVALVSGIVSSPFGSVPALTCTGAAGDTWRKVGESGVDPTSGVNLALFVCSTTQGGSAYTITVTFPFPSAGFSCLLMEFAGYDYPVVVDSGAGIAANHVTQAWTITAQNSVLAGDLALAAVSSLPVVPNAPASGWTQVLSDTAGVGYACMQLATAAGTLTSTWTGPAIAGTDMVLTALRPSPGFQV